MNQSAAGCLGTGSLRSNEGTTFHGMIGSSTAMQDVYRRIDRFAKSAVSILILGETGTGKDMAAQAIRMIYACQRPFVVLNCATVSKTLVESELFGHEQGSFTGASRRHQGILTQADGGILFLDEVAELPLSIQAKLLRAVETGEFRPVGGERILHSRFRLIAATNRNLDRLAGNRFRLDLLHRLGAARITLPPLRERREDIIPLAREFLLHFRAVNREVGPASFSNAAERLLVGGDWPGNVRELKNVVEAASVGAEGAVDPAHLAEFLAPPRWINQPATALPTLAEAVRLAEKTAIQSALRLARGDRERAADLLGISAATLYRRLAQLTSPAVASRKQQGLGRTDVRREKRVPSLSSGRMI